MATKFTASSTQLRPDPRFGSKLVSKFVNCLMHDGKKSVALAVFYNAMDVIKKRLPDQDPVEVFHSAVENVKPQIEVRSRRVGGANYQVPREVRPERRLALALRWIVEAAEGTKGKPMHESLIHEIRAARKGEGSACTKKENVHKMAEANKAFAHFAW